MGSLWCRIIPNVFQKYGNSVLLLGAESMEPIENVPDHSTVFAWVCQVENYASHQLRAINIGVKKLQRPSHVGGQVEPPTLRRSMRQRGITLIEKDRGHSPPIGFLVLILRGGPFSVRDI